MKKTWYKFLSVHFIFWSIIPLLRSSLPLDSIEAIVWGQIGGLGTNKHPTLSGFPADFIYSLFGGADISIYILSQIFILAGFIYIFRLAKLFLPEQKAILSTMLLEGVIYYGFTSAEYNVNIISLFLWPFASFYFCRAILEERKTDWIMFGIAGGLNILNKYVGGILFIAMGMYLILTNKGREQLKTFGPYLSAAIGIMIVAPHFYWLYQHDFFVISYFMGRSSEASNWLGHIIYPIEFIGAQFIAGLMAIIIFFSIYFKAKKQKSTTPHIKNQIIFYVGIMPLILFVSIALICGIHLKSMWGTPLLYMLGICLFTKFNFKETEQMCRKMIIGVYMSMSILGLGAALIYSLNKSEKMHFPRGEFANSIIENWKKQTNNSPLPYVGGEIWYAANLSLYSADHPYVILDTNLTKNPWVSNKDLYTKGAIIFMGKGQSYQDAHKKYIAASPMFTQQITFKNLLGKSKTRDVNYFIIYPEGVY